MSRPVYFNVERHVGGTLIQKFEVRANACKGLMDVPDFGEMAKQLPGTILKAVSRGLWWQDLTCPDVLRLDMQNAKGQPIGTLFAKKV